MVKKGIGTENIAKTVKENVKSRVKINIKRELQSIIS